MNVDLCGIVAFANAFPASSSAFEEVRDEEASALYRGNAGAEQGCFGRTERVRYGFGELDFWRASGKYALFSALNSKFTQKNLRSPNEGRVTVDFNSAAATMSSTRVRNSSN
jgi:hypothetical protein